MSRRRDPSTLDLFAWEPASVVAALPEEATGRGPLDLRIAKALSYALDRARDAGLKREDVAAELTEFLRRKVSLDMLNKWAAPGSEAHRIPLDAFIGLIKVTSEIGLLGFVAEMFEQAVVPAKYAAVIELHQLEQAESEMAARKAKVMAQVRGLRS